MKRFLLLATLLIGLGTASAQAERTLTVFAAASLGGALEEIAQSYPTEVTFAYGGSGVMARQVAAGAPADVVILANTEWMDWLQKSGTFSPQAEGVVTGNQLVVIAPEGAQALEKIAELPNLLETSRLAMGHRTGVPAGVYAQQWMQSAGLWSTLEPQLAETDNVRAALALVARRQASLGVVYASDAQAEPAVTVIYGVPQDSHDPILYPATALSPEGAAFVAHLLSPKAARVFESRGFVTPAS